MCVLAFLSTMICSEGFCVGCCSLVGAFGDFLSRGFFPLPIGHKEEFQSHTQHNTHARSGEEHKKRTLSVVQKKAFRDDTARRPKRKRRGRPKAKSYILAFYRKTERRIRYKKKDLIICLGFVNVALSFGVFLCVSLSLRTPLFSSPLFRPRQVHKADSRGLHLVVGKEMYI